MTGFSHRALQAAYISLLVLAAGAARSDAQSLITEKALSVDSALAVANGALDKCHADGYRVSLTVLDASGLVKVQVRGDGTGPHTLEHSRRKALRHLRSSELRRRRPRPGPRR
jgi:hypothetical protein